MNWYYLLAEDIEHTYAIAEGLIDRVEDADLPWKPATGANWLTTAQLLHHMTDACGAPMRGFVTGDWGLPEGMDVADIPPEDMLPPAEKFPAVTSVAEARSLLAADKAVARDMLARCTPDQLATQRIAAPWNPVERPLGRHLLDMVRHLDKHATQLFYYLKLQGKPVNTGDLWGG